MFFFIFLFPFFLLYGYWVVFNSFFTYITATGSFLSQTSKKFSKKFQHKNLPAKIKTQKSSTSRQYEWPDELLNIRRGQ
jgi:hypothetical protein